MLVQYIALKAHRERDKVQHSTAFIIGGHVYEQVHNLKIHPSMHYEALMPSAKRRKENKTSLNV